MLKFLIGVIIAIILFVPACNFISNVFRTTQQARENFEDLYQNLVDINNSKDPIAETMILILDEGSAVVYFNKGADKLVVDGDATGLNRNFEVHFLRSDTTCSNEEACICLMNEFTVEESGGFIREGLSIAIPVSPICRNTDINLDFAKCGFGTLIQVASQECKGGALIDRGVVSSELPRRITVQLRKEGDKITVDAS